MSKLIYHIFMEDTKKTPVEREHTESITMTQRKSIDANGLLQDVHLCGLESENGYGYLEAALKEACNLYENVDVYSNHTQVKGPRKQEDKVGFIKGPARFVEGKGSVGDIQFNIEHPNYASTKWWIENAPKKLGMSHVIGGDFSEDENKVVKIKRVKSVDLVSTPATTSGMFLEGIISDAIKKDQKDSRLYNTLSKAWSLMWDIMYPLSAVLTDEEKAVKLGPILDDLELELQTFVTSKTESKEDDMKDLAELKAKHPELFEAAIAEGKKQGVADGSKKERELIEKQEALIKDIPSEKRSKVFLKQIRESLEKGDEEGAKEIVEDRKSTLTVETVESKHTEIKDTTNKPSEKKVISEDDILEAVK